MVHKAVELKIYRKCTAQLQLATDKYGSCPRGTQLQLPELIRPVKLGNQNRGWKTKLGETMTANKYSKQQNRKHSGWNEQHNYASESITSPTKHPPGLHHEWTDCQLSPSSPSLKGRTLILDYGRLFSWD